MARERVDEYVLELEEEADFADETDLFTGSESRVRIWGLDVSSLNNEWIDDQSYQVGGGARPKIRGVSHNNIAVPFSTYAEGLGTAAGDGVAAAATGVTKLLASCVQRAPILTTGSVAAAGATTTSVTEADSGSHAVSGGIGIMAAALPDGTVKARPYTYATATATMLMAYPYAPAEDAVLYGAAVLPYLYKWSGAAGYSLACRFLGADKHQHRKILGSVGTFSIPEVGAAEVPQLDFSMKAATFEDLLEGLARVSPGYSPGQILAGSECIIAAHGQTAGASLCPKRIGFDLSAGYLPDECLHQATGIAGWIRDKTPPQITVTVPHDAATPAGLTSAATTYRDSLRAITDQYHVLLNLSSGGPGKSLSVYFPRCLLQAVEPVEVGEMDGQALTFVPLADVTTPLCIIAQW